MRNISAMALRISSDGLSWVRASHLRDGAAGRRGGRCSRRCAVWIAVARRTGATLASVLAVALAVVGCGQSGHHSPKSLSTRSPGSTTAPRPVRRVALQDLSWRSASDGWALAVAEGCKTGRCARLLHTTDGGHDWQEVATPAAQFGDDAYICEMHPCVSAVSFATASVGYLYEPGLMMTRDAGRNWHAQPGRLVETLSIEGSRVYRVAYQHTGCPGPCEPALQASPIGSTRWRTLIGTLATPGRSGSAQIVGSGSTVLLALYGSQAGPVSAQAVVYRSGDAGVSWEQRRDPCSGRGPRRAGEEDLVALASAAGGFFAGLCTPHAGVASAFLVTSTNAGATWQSAGPLPPVQYPRLLAAASNSTLAVSTGPTGGSGQFTARLLITTDAGHNWHKAASDPQQLTQAGAPAWLDFQTPTTGRWIADPYGVWTTRDSGADWARIALLRQAGFDGDLDLPRFRWSRVAELGPRCRKAQVRGVSARHNIALGSNEIA